MTQQLRQASDEIQTLKQKMNETPEPVLTPPVRRDSWPHASEFISFLQTADADQLQAAQKLYSVDAHDAQVIQVLLNSKVPVDDRVRHGL